MRFLAKSSECQQWVHKNKERSKDSEYKCTGNGNNKNEILCMYEPNQHKV